MTFISLKKSLLPGFSVMTLFLATHSAASAPLLPNPVLYLVGTEVYQANGKQFVRLQVRRAQQSRLSG